MGVNLSTGGAGSPGVTPQILQAAQLAQASKYACLATLAAATCWAHGPELVGAASDVAPFVGDWIVSLSSEYRTICESSLLFLGLLLIRHHYFAGKAKNSPIKFLYLISRYVGLASAFCRSPPPPF